MIDNETIQAQLLQNRFYSRDTIIYEVCGIDTGLYNVELDTLICLLCWASFEFQKYEHLNKIYHLKSHIHMCWVIEKFEILH